MSKVGLFLQRGPQGKSFVSRAMTVPNYAAGDAQFLDDTRPHEVQLRPLLPSERTPNSTGKYPRGASMLVFKPSIGMELRALVHMPSRQRANTPENVQSAVKSLARFDQGVAKLFELALNGDAVLFGAEAI